MRPVALSTSLLRDEVDRVDEVTVMLGTSRWQRAGTLRAMLRFALANRTDFLVWYQATEGQPVEQ